MKRMKFLLKDKTYSITKSYGDEGKLVFELSLDPLDEIYKVHFPGNPVLPGAYMIQIARELAQEVIGVDAGISVIRSAKYLAPVFPDRTPSMIFEVSLSVTEAGMQWKGVFRDGLTVFCRLNILFKKG